MVTDVHLLLFLFSLSLFSISLSLFLHLALSLFSCLSLSLFMSVSLCSRLSLGVGVSAVYCWCVSVCVRGMLKTSVCRFKTPPHVHAKRPCHMRHADLTYVPRCVRLGPLVDCRIARSVWNKVVLSTCIYTDLVPLERRIPVPALEMEMCLWCPCGVFVVWCVSFSCGLRLPSKRLVVTPAVCPRLL